MVSNIGTANAYTYNPVMHSIGAKVHVPVNPQYVVYSQLEHISGIAAEQNQRGVHLSKIQILNTLIDQLSSVKSQNSKAEPNILSDTSDEARIDKLIQNYQSQIHTAMKLAETNPFMPGAAAIQPGAIFSISA